MKIASVKKKMPSIAKPVPKTSPHCCMNFGHSRPISKESTVPVTAPTANSTAAAFDHCRARLRASASSCVRPLYSAISMIAGSATPMHDEDDVEAEGERHHLARGEQVVHGERQGARR